MTTTLDKHIIKHLRLLACFIALCLVSPCIAWSANLEVVGSDGGSVSVGNSGQAAWSMPVEVPSGINGVAPKLSLSVSASGGNGILGVGAGLSGLSAISRCGRTHYQDGFSQAPQYQQDDAYCLDGARLVLESGTYGAAGSVYRTQIESFQRIKAHGAVEGKGPAYFEVTNRAGARLIYGQNSQHHTRETDPITGAAVVWKLDTLIDSNSNTLHYHYANIGDDADAPQMQLSQITYGGNQNMGVAETVSVRFIYQDRPDTASLWSRGQRYTQSKRMTQIQTWVGDKLVKDYRIRYQQGAVTQASRIAKVQECAGNGNCYRPSQFHYTPEADTQWTRSPIMLPDDLQAANGNPLGELVDINNDGKTDWVTAYQAADGSQQIKTYLGSLTGWQQNSDFDLPNVLYDYRQHEDGFPVGSLLDVNGDGWVDYVQAYQDADGQQHIQSWRNTGQGFIKDNSLNLPAALLRLDSQGKAIATAQVADLNADNLPDLVQSVVLPNGQTLHQTWLHQFNDGQHSWVINDAFKTPMIGSDHTQGSEGRLLASLQDVNGDGLGDWVQSYQLNAQTHNQTWLNTGRGWQASEQYRLPVAMINYDLTDNGVSVYTLTDLNGDGLPDLSQALQIQNTEQTTDHFDAWLHTGMGWQRDSAYHLPAPSMRLSANGKVAILGGLTDLNSDGQPDFAISFSDSEGDNQQQWVFNRDTNQWQASEQTPLPFINNHIQQDGRSLSAAQMVDLNHDGYPELLNTLNGDVYQTTPPEKPGAFPGTLQSVVNSLGALTTLEYAITTDPAVYQLAEQTPYPNIAYNSPVRVIKTIAVSDGIGGMITAEHRYGKAKTNVLGQGGLGYQYHAMQDGKTQIEVVTEFHQTYPYAGRMKSSAKYLNNTAFSESSSETVLHTIDINGLKTHYPHPVRSTSKSHDFKGRLIKRTESVSEIDNHGNATLNIDKIYDDSGNLVRTAQKQTDYKAPDLARWLIGLPIKTTQTLTDHATDQTYKNTSTAEFAADGKVLSETLEPGNDHAVTKSYTYDGFGHRISHTLSANGIEPRTSATSFTADGRFPSAVTNNQGNQINSVFDPVLGKPLSVTDPNGIRKEFLYDGFGTTLKETKAHQSNGATRGRQIVLPKWCDAVQGSAEATCPTGAVYFIAAFDDEGEAPEIAYYNVNGKELRKQTYGFHNQQDLDQNRDKIIVVDTQYNADGKVARVSQPYFKGIDSPQWTTYEYDILGRQIKRTNAANDVFTTDYDGLTVTTINPGNDHSGRQTHTVINNIFGQPIKAIDADGYITQYQYDGRGKLINTIDAENNTATITYDKVFGRKIAMDDPDLGQWRYQYNALGKLISQTDAKGQVTTLRYDALNRLVERIDDAGGEQQGTTTWTYSEQKTGDQIIGGLSQVNSPNYQRTLSYDDYGRVIKATSTIDEQSFTQRTGYMGTADKVDWLQYPSGLTVRNTYDDFGFPKTVEGIQLNVTGYDEFQAAYAKLNDLQRQLEQFKDAHLTDSQLAELEEHQRQVRRLGTALADFYDDFDNDPAKQQHDDEIERYADLLKQVQTKLDQHGNWVASYQTAYDAITTRYKPQLDEIKRRQKSIRPLKARYDELKPDYDYYTAKIRPYADGIRRHQAEIEKIGKLVEYGRSHIKREMEFLFIPRIAKIYYDHPEQFFKDIEGAPEYVTKHYMTTRNADTIKIYLTLIIKRFEVIAKMIGQEESSDHQYMSNVRRYSSLPNQGPMRLEDVRAYLGNFQVLKVDKRSSLQVQLDIIKSKYQPGYDHWSKYLEPIAKEMNDKGKQIKAHSDRINAVLKPIQPHIDRMSLRLGPIVESHNNILLSYTDRARLYARRLASHSGSYAKRDDLKTDNFLKPFNNHLNYIRCLRDQKSKTSGACYAENLVHVVHDDGTVNTAKQAEARAKVDSDTRVNAKQFYNTRRFFCGDYHGYSCAGDYKTQIMQLAKTMHALQCQRDSDQPDDWAPCDRKQWLTLNSKSYRDQLAERYEADYIQQHLLNYRYRYLHTSIADLSTANLEDWYAQQLAEPHQRKVVNLVSTATQDSYHAETRYQDIVQYGGNLWQANPESAQDDAPDADQDAKDGDAKEFVLIYKGNLQRLADQQMNDLAKQANRELKQHQQAIESLLNQAQETAYNDLYLAVQNQSLEVQRLYNALDQDYSDYEDEDDYHANKKIYWQAEQINAQGQIVNAKYGNGVSTEWGYDQFGRINGHLSQNAEGETLLNQRYHFDAIGNLASRTDHVQALQQDYEYDRMNRLVTANLSGQGANVAISAGVDSIHYQYDALGNLTYKSDLFGGQASNHGSYRYGKLDTDDDQHAGPHAVSHIAGVGNFSYDANGNQLTGHGRTIDYAPFNKPTRIDHNGKRTDLEYGAERQLIKQVEEGSNNGAGGTGANAVQGSTNVAGAGGTGATTTLYVGGLYETIQQLGTANTLRHHIAIAGRAIAVVETQQSAPEVVTKEHYLHKNHQNSVIAITDHQGKVVERRHYDAFGALINYLGNDNAANTLHGALPYDSVTDLSFTGHRFLSSANVIHMKGRVYDPVIGRFLSADPHIQSPLNSQSLNRYSYVLNNPLSLTDPSGYFFSSLLKKLKKLFNKIKRIIKKLARVIKKIGKIMIDHWKKVGRFIKKYARVIVAVVVAAVVTYLTAGALAGWGGAIVSGAIAGAAGGAVAGLIMTGSLKGMLEGAMFGAITGGFAGWANSYSLSAAKLTVKVARTFKVGINIANKIISVAGHAVIGGLRALYNGGKFLTGFITAGVGKAITMGTNAFAAGINIGGKLGTKLLQGLVVATSGGVVAMLAGGSFEMGFLTAGLAFATNEITQWRAKMDFSRKMKKVINLGADLDESGADLLLKAQQSGNGVKAVLDKDGNLTLEGGNVGRTRIALPETELSKIGIRSGAAYFDFAAAPDAGTFSISAGIGKSFGSYNAKIQITLIVDIESLVMESHTFGPAVRHQKYGSTKRIEQCEANGWVGC